ncbi:MAG: choice-of-anchor A family protein, partial [Reinekea sp.]
MKISVVPLLSLLILCSSFSHAQNFGSAQPYNALVFNNFTATASDVEGRLAAGGDISLLYYAIGQQLTTAPPDPVLIAGGDITFPNGSVYNGDILAAGSIDGIDASVVNAMAAGATVTGNAALPINFAEVQNELTQLSSDLAALQANTEAVYQWGGLYMTANCDANSQVFQLDGEQVLSANSFNVDLSCAPANATYIFNISGVSAGMTNMGLQSLEAVRDHVVYNFYEATSLTLQSIGVQGSVLAPLADLENPAGVIYGHLYANSWNGPMQINSVPFVGDLSTIANNENSAPMITSEAIIPAYESVEYQYQVTAEDTAEDLLSYQLTQAPKGMSLSAETGLLTWPQPNTDFSNGLTADNLYCSESGLSNSQYAPAADVVVVMDYSGSMNGEWAWIQDLIPSLEAGLKAAGIGTDLASPNLYGLTATDYRDYGTANQMGGSLLGGYDEFVATAKSFKGSGYEDGWSGLVKVIESYPLRENLPHNLILVTDEDRDNHNSALSYDSVRDSLLETGVTLNAVLETTIVCGDNGEITAMGMDSHGIGYAADGNGGYFACTNPQIKYAYGTTKDDYVALAFDLGGAVWSIAQLRSGGLNALSFSKVLQDIKVQEIVRQLPDTNMADLAINQVREQDGKLAFTVKNRGLVASSPFNARIETSSDAEAWQILSSIPVSTLDPATSTKLSVALDTLPLDSSYVRLSLIAEDASSECDINNNSAIISHVSLMVTDSEGKSDTQSYWLPVQEQEQIPQIISEPMLKASVGSQYRYALSVADDLGDSHLYTLETAPLGMSIDSYNGVLNWTPTSDQLGEQTVEISVIDIQGNSVKQSFSVTVTESGQASNGPAFVADYSGIPFVSDTVVELPLEVSGGGDQVLKYELLVAPDYCRFSEAQAGLLVCDYSGISSPAIPQIFVKVSDEQGRYDTLLVMIDRAPRITSHPVNIIKAGNLFVGSLTGTDPERDLYSLSLINGPDGMTGRTDASRRLKVRWTPGDEFIGTTETYTVRITDAYGVFSESVFEIQVVDNQAPSFQSSPVTHAVAGRTYGYTMTAKDPDGDKLTYTLVSGPEGMTLSNSKLSWDIPVGTEGTFPVSVQVSDGDGGLGTQDFEISIEPNYAPIFTSTPTTTVITGHQYLSRNLAKDANRDSFRFELVSGPDGMTSNYWNAGYTRWTPTHEQAGTYEVTMRVYDNYGGESLQTYTLTVVLDQRPELTQLPLDTAIVGHRYLSRNRATDADGDAIVFSMISGPDGMSVDSSNGGYTRWVPTEAQIGTHSVTLQAKDRYGMGIQYTFPITVYANQAPQITSVPKAGAVPGRAYLSRNIATDSDGDTVKLALVSGPDGLTVDVANGGYIRWTPTADQAGEHSVTLRAYDAYGGETQQTFTLIVYDTLAFTQLPEDQTIEAETRFSYTVKAEYPEGMSVRYRAVSVPEGFTITTSGSISWSPALDQAGNHDIVLEAYLPDESLTAEGRFTLTVIAPNQPPVIEEADALQAIVAHPSSWQMTATDPEGETLSFALIGAPAGMTISNNGEISWTPALSQIGDYSVTVIVTDPLGLSATTTVSIVITIDPALLPYLGNLPTAEATVGSPYAYQILALDSDGYSANVELINGPEGMVLIQNSQHLDELRWTPAEGDCLKEVTLRLSDRYGQTVET